MQSEFKLSLLLVQSREMILRVKIFFTACESAKDIERKIGKSMWKKGNGMEWMFVSVCFFI